MERADPAGKDVVELAPGLGHTAAVIASRGPASYVGVDRDPEALRQARDVLGDRGIFVEGDAAATGRDDQSADLVLGEAMLTMQNEKNKQAVVAEAFRVLRPGGTYAIHELAMTPDEVADDIKTTVRTELARAIKVNARPLTPAEWGELLRGSGFEVLETKTAPMALLEPKRIIADEGLRGAARFFFNVLRRPDARRRVLRMRSVFRANRDSLAGIAVVARRPG